MKRTLVLNILLLLFYSASSVAASNYIYRQRLNWVKITKASPSELQLGTLRHPFAGITVEQAEGMLLSIKIAKKYLLKKEIQTADVFNSWEARKFAPHLVEALSRVDPDHVVNFSVIHKRPAFILRNDRLTIGNVWAADDGIHFRFSKLFAKMDGDYEATANMDRAVRKAKTMRVTLEAHEGQKLSYSNPTEVILDPAFNFAAQVAAVRQQALAEENAELEGSSKRIVEKEKKEKVKAAKKAKTEDQPKVAASNAATEDASLAVGTEDRLKKLDELKAKKLVTEKEYREARRRILSEI